MEGADRAFELAHRLQDVQHFDFVDEPIEPQPHRGVRNAVRLRQFLQRSRRKQKSLEESEVFVIENVDPALHARSLSKLKSMSIIFIFLFNRVIELLEAVY